MVTRWHLLRLPVRVEGHQRHLTLVKNVVVDWSDLVLQGFVLESGPFRTLFLPADAGVRITTTGIEMASRSLVQRRNRRWRKQWVQSDWIYGRLLVHDPQDRVVGMVKDLIIDEDTLQVQSVVVSRGLLADLLYGALVVSAPTIWQDVSGKIKIDSLGYAKNGDIIDVK